MELAAATVLLPTRRACRALAEAFLRQGGGAALLLPTLSPIGDLDGEELDFTAGSEEPGSPDALEIPPAIPEMRRQMLLTRLILARAEAEGGGQPSPAQAARLAAELARLIDQVRTERLSFDALADLVPEELAGHWQVTLKFLTLVTENWPAVLDGQGCIDPAERRNRVIAARIASWRESPPTDAVIVAGSTGTVPATADLIAAVAELPDGMVLLPGLDTALDTESLENIGDTHPQSGMVRLLARLEFTPGEIPVWGATGTPGARSALLRDAMRPAGAGPASAQEAEITTAIAGVRRIDCPGPREEAGIIALLLREALEQDEKTAALITADRGLARRVAAELRRWDIEIDDSAGRPLAETPPGVFLRLIAAMAVEDAAPVPLLATLKHPLAAGGMATAEFRARVRLLERAALRGPRPAGGLQGIAAALAATEGNAELEPWLTGFSEIAAPFLAAVGRRAVPMRDLIAAHVECAEALAKTDCEAGSARLWAGDAGEAAYAFLGEMSDAAAALGVIDGRLWFALFEALMAGRVVRPSHGRHPRLNIWGPLESRLQRADLMVLGGLNEGSWPPDPGTDPWMSRPMRAQFGLPPIDRRIGLAAHDFTQAVAAGEVVLTRARRVEGTPTVPSRWLLRLDNVLERADLKDALTAGQETVTRWQALLDNAEPIYIKAPAPIPPVEARPRRLSVTQIETLMRDPYAVYARHVLGLGALDPIDADPGAADRGTIIHDALDDFLREFPDDLPTDAGDRLLEIGERSFGSALARPGVRAFWWPRFERIAAWFVETERARRAGIASTATEVSGEIDIAAPGGPFTLAAKADRIDLHHDGGLSIIDYKTGAAPSKKQVTTGHAPQLPLEAVIAAEGGFEGIAPAMAAALAFWQLSGGDPPARETVADSDIERVTTAARAGLEALIASYDDPDTPYLAQPDPDRAPRFSDYEHLERIKEWFARNREERP